MVAQTALDERMRAPCSGLLAGDQQASDLEVKERQVKAAIKNMVRT